MKLALVAVSVLVLVPFGIGLYMSRVENPRVERELRQDPEGERAGIVMLITLPSGGLCR